MVACSFVTRAFVALMAPAPRLQGTHSGPVQAVRSSVCPRSHGWFGSMGLPVHFGPCLAHMTPPAFTACSQRARSALCAMPYPRASRESWRLVMVVFTSTGSAYHVGQGRGCAPCPVLPAGYRSVVRGQWPGARVTGVVVGVGVRGWPGGRCAGVGTGGAGGLPWGPGGGVRRGAGGFVADRGVPTRRPRTWRGRGHLYLSSSRMP